MASPSTALSLIQRLSAKEWNVRLAANEELLVLFNEANESHVADFAKYGTFKLAHFNFYC